MMEDKLRELMDDYEKALLEKFLSHVEKHRLEVREFQKKNPDKKMTREYNPYGCTPTPATYEISETSIGTVFKGICNYPKCGFVLNMTDYGCW